MPDVSYDDRRKYGNIINMKSQLHILIPYYNNRLYLREAVKSIRKQNSQNWRLTIIDDAGPEDDSKWVTDLNDKRIEYFRNKKNLGFAKNFQNCLKYTKGDWCMLMGADDKLKPGFVRRFQAIAPKLVDVAFYQPNVEVIDEKAEKCLPLGDKFKAWLRPKQSGVYRGDNALVRLMTGNYLYFPSIVWRQRIIKKIGFSDRYGTLTDLELVTKIIMKGGKFYLDNGTKIFQYRRHNSVSSKNRASGKFYEDETKYYNWAIGQFRKLGFKNATRAAKIRFSSRLARYLG